MDIGFDNTIALISPESEEEVITSLLIGQPGSGKTYWIKQIIKYMMKDTPDRKIYFVGKTVAQYSDIAGEFTNVFRYRSLVANMIPLEHASDAIIVLDDLSTADSKKCYDLIEIARNHKCDIFHLCHHLRYIDNAVFSLYNLFVVFNNSINLAFDRMYKHALNIHGEKKEIYDFYKNIHKHKYWKFVVNKSHTFLPYFCIDENEDVIVDKNTEFSDRWT
jgi:hypothetical protein